MEQEFFSDGYDSSHRHDDSDMRLTSENSEKLLTVSDVAEWLGVSKGWVYDHATRKQPRLPCIRFGQVTRFRRADIEKFIEQHVKAYEQN